MANENEREKRETIAEVVATMRRGTKIRGLWRSCDLNEILAYHADRIEAISRRAYSEIDSAMCGIESASSTDIDAVRAALDNTIGEYYE